MDRCTINQTVKTQRPDEIFGRDPPQLAGISLSELQRPVPYRLIGNINAALGERILDVAVVERKSEIQPDSVLNGPRWKSIVAVGDFFASQDATAPTKQRSRSLCGNTGSRADVPAAWLELL
jgi:hypothetical protein